jgi:N-acetylglucosaminyldiphosphoundecaprenol N-acetyl-beta-D-mannosaminyltransferase
MNGLYSRDPSPYSQALLAGDQLLPDGIALRLLHFAWHHPEIAGWRILWEYRYYSTLAVANCNGTDFIPELVDALPKEYTIILYGCTAAGIPKALEFASERFGRLCYWMHGYLPFDWSLLDIPGPVILLVGRGSPKQETWVLEQKERLQARGNVLVCTVGGLFDFWAEIETRAPFWMRNAGLEWLYRVATEPRKNLRKAATSLLFFYRILFRR